jgi:hypothetical protein
MLSRCAPIALCLALFAFACAADAQDGAKLAVSLNPLTAEELAVYNAVLAGWISKDTPVVNLADRTVPLGGADPAGGGAPGCGKGLDLELLSPTLVHEFHVGDVAKLGSAKIVLVNSKRGDQDVKENDPWKSIQKGRSVEDSVRNGFAHGLFTLSEIQFDKKHEHAIVSYSFVCGGLCGNGATVILEKSNGGWRVAKQCDGWISLVTPRHGCVAVVEPA